MTTITLPKELTNKGELVIIPRKEYEEFLSLKKLIPIFKPTRYDLRALGQGRKEIRDGQCVEWRILKYELENLRNQSRRKTT